MSEDLDIQTVTEIFIRVNSAGVVLNQADFAMSKIAVNEQYQGHILRKAIDYFCHLAVDPGAITRIENDEEFRKSAFFSRVRWLASDSEGLYDPDYSDVLRVAYGTEFRRGNLEDFVALLAGRNFASRTYEEEIISDSFAKLHNGLMTFMNEYDFKQFTLIIKSAGLIVPGMLNAKNATSYAYSIYLLLKRKGVPPAILQKLVRRWLVMSLLTSRYSGSVETTFDRDIRMIDESVDPVGSAEAVIAARLSDTFWEVELPSGLTTSSTTNQQFQLYKAAQVKLGDRGFLSADYLVKDLVEVKSDVHHIFPKDYLKNFGVPTAQYNQVANFAITQTEINIGIGNKPPQDYFAAIYDQVSGGPMRYGGITDPEMLAENLRQNCVPTDQALLSVERYQDFLIERRLLMARRIRTFFEAL